MWSAQYICPCILRRSLEPRKRVSRPFDEQWAEHLLYPAAPPARREFEISIEGDPAGRIRFWRDDDDLVIHDAKRQVHHKREAAQAL